MVRSFLCALLLTTCATVPPGRLLVVKTDHGPLAGFSQDGLRVFLGVPYAAPPVGERRWRPPAELESWTQPREATRSGPACMQPPVPGVDHVLSEDCLTLNLWVPAGTKPLPVMVWIHGGGFYTGSNSDALYDGAKLAAHTGAIVVGLNYRLGVFGFLGHRELGTASVGLLDQQAALRWVQHNIAAFGGDASNVTLFGESAGAWSTCSQLAMPGSRGLFARGIIQSGACSDALYFTAERALAQGDALAAAVGCSDAACLRSKPAQALLDALPMKRGMLLPPGVWWGPVIDGTSLPELPLAALRAGRAAEVPLIFGWARDEGIAHLRGFDEVKQEEVVGFLDEHFGEKAAKEMPAHYASRTPKELIDRVITDGVFACSARRVANLLTARGVPVFLYELTHPLDDPGPHDLGATHSVELFFVFGNEDRVDLSERERPMVRTVMTAWGNFARDGNPTSEAMPWPRWTTKEQRYVTLDLTSEVLTHPKSLQCDAWDRVER